MKLSEYIPKHETGASFAKRIGVKDSIVSTWRSGVRKVPAERCPEIEKATNGLVTCEEMRPDVDWQFVRNAKNKSRRNRFVN